MQPRSQRAWFTCMDSQLLFRLFLPVMLFLCSLEKFKKGPNKDTSEQGALSLRSDFLIHMAICSSISSYQKSKFGNAQSS